MPFVPPDPIFCRIVLIARNKSFSESLSGLSISEAVVARVSSDERLGQIFFSTGWDGRMGPGEQDTVRLTKISGQLPVFSPPCGKYVYLNLLVRNGAGDLSIVKMDSLYFGCVY